MNVRTSACAAALLLVALPFAGQAAEPRYTYAQAGYFNFDIDDSNVDGDGFSVGGSLALTDLVHVVANYADGDGDVGPFDADYSQFDIALGLNVNLQPGLDVVGRVGYVDVEVDTPFGDADDDGYSLEGLLRWMANEQLELDAGVQYVDLDDSGSDTAFTVAGLYNITPNLALGAGLSVSDDVTQWTFGGRYYFDLGR